MQIYVILSTIPIIMDTDYKFSDIVPNWLSQIVPNMCLSQDIDDLYAGCTEAERTKKSPKAHTKTNTSSQEKLFGEIQNSFLL